MPNSARDQCRPLPIPRFFIMHLYDRVLLKRRSSAYAWLCEGCPGIFLLARFQRDRHGNPTGPTPGPGPTRNILYSNTGPGGPKLSREDQLNSSRLFFRELNRFGVDQCPLMRVEASRNYPDDYEVVDELHRNNELSIRLAYNLFTQKPKQEARRFSAMDQDDKARPGRRFSIASTAPGEMLVFSAADFEDFSRTAAGPGARHGK